MHILKIRLNYETFFEFRPSLDIRFARLSLRDSTFLFLKRVSQIEVSLYRKLRFSTVTSNSSPYKGVQKLL